MALTSTIVQLGLLHPGDKAAEDRHILIDQLEGVTACFLKGTLQSYTKVFRLVCDQSLMHEEVHFSRPDHDCDYRSRT